MGRSERCHGYVVGFRCVCLARRWRLAYWGSSFSAQTSSLRKNHQRVLFGVVGRHQSLRGEAEPDPYDDDVKDPRNPPHRAPPIREIRGVRQIQVQTMKQILPEPAEGMTSKTRAQSKIQNPKSKIRSILSIPVHSRSSRLISPGIKTAQSSVTTVGTCGLRLTLTIRRGRVILGPAREAPTKPPFFIGY